MPGPLVGGAPRRAAAARARARAAAHRRLAASARRGPGGGGRLRRGQRAARRRGRVRLVSDEHPLLVFVGAGGVGKTTLAAALGVASARAGRDTLVMTFDPSLRLKDALGVGQEAKEHAVRVDLEAVGELHASLLDAAPPSTRRSSPF